MRLEQNWTHCEWSININSILCSRASRACKDPFLSHPHLLTGCKKPPPTPGHFWLHHGYTKLLKTLSSAVSSKLLISEAQKKNQLKKTPVEDPGPWKEATGWPRPAPQSGSPRREQTRRQMSACALRSLAVKRLPNTRVKGGDFRWWCSVGAGKPVDSRRGGAFPARRPVGTDIRLEAGDDAARENGASAP